MKITTRKRTYTMTPYMLTDNAPLFMLYKNNQACFGGRRGFVGLGRNFVPDFTLVFGLNQSVEGLAYLFLGPQSLYQPSTHFSFDYARQIKKNNFMFIYFNCISYSITPKTNKYF